MPGKSHPDVQKSQLDKFKDAARELGADEDEAHWDEQLRKIAVKKNVQKDARKP